MGKEGANGSSPLEGSKIRSKRASFDEIHFGSRLLADPRNGT